MALVLKNNVLYLHIPKTGGNWLTKMVHDQGLVKGELGHKHATFDYISPRPGALRSMTSSWRHISGSPTVLCVVRNPLSWYESWFRYQISREWRDWGQEGNPGRWHVCAALNPCKAPDFMTFMRSVNKQVPGFLTCFLGRYTHGANATVLRNETLAQDFVAFAERVDLPVDRDALLTAGRVGESPKMKLEWDDEVLRETVENERAAFRAYGYELPERAKR